MIEIKKATLKDTAKLTETQMRTFQDDNKLKPPGCNMGGPPGYDSVDWNVRAFRGSSFGTSLILDTDNLCLPDVN